MMKCSNCKQIIPDDSEFCHLCGSKISRSDPANKKTKPPREPMNSKTKKMIIIGVSAFVVIAIVLASVFCLILPMNKYNHAKELMENGKYDLAYTEFSELGNFSDAKDKLTETRYLQALEYREKGDYDVANKIFETLGDYRDSKTMIHHHDYKTTASTPKTCTTNGSETKTCSSCDHTYTNTIEASHSYKSATCTTPKTCTVCEKTEGSALGHSSSIICSRCGAKTFEKLSYTGTGSKVIDYTLPSGKFRVTVTATSGKAIVSAKIYHGNSYEYLSIYDAGNSEIETITGPVSGGTIVVNADDDYFGKSSWKITIESIEN